MTDDNVFYLIDQHLEAEYAFANAGDLESLQTQVAILSDQVDSQAIHIASLTSDRDQLIKLIAIVAEKQGIEIRVEQ